MKKCFIFALLFVSSTTVAYADPIDLSGWTPTGSGSWTVQGGGDSVFQSVNTSNGTTFTSTDNYIDTEYKGTMNDISTDNFR